jgi:LmbE family N-acetylglucosaminyl deacetylase
MNSLIADCSPLTRPLDLPLYSIDKIVNEIKSESILVVAPHPDDETLGCGGAIALLRSRGYTVKILVVSDGTQSHPNSSKYPAPVLRNLRATETIWAMGLLGVETNHIAFLQLPDGAVPKIREPDFQAAVNRFCTYLELANPKIVFAPSRSDPHPDHRATWQILCTAIRQSRLSPRVIEYPIWDWDLKQRKLSNQDVVHPWRLDIAEVLALKQQAIAAYRSQTTNLIDDDPNGFRLTAEMLENFAQPWEIYLEENY